MKRIEAIIRPSKLRILKEELAAIGINGMTVFEAGGYGRQRGHEEIFRGNEYEVDLIPKISVVIVVKDEVARDVIWKITDVCKTGKVGDGKIFVSTIDEVIRIRTGENGESAL